MPRDRRGLTEPHTATSQSFVTMRMPLLATPHWRVSQVPDEPPTLRESGLYYVPQPLSRFQQFSSRIEMRALSLRVRAHSLEHRKHDLPRGFPLSDPFSRNKPDGERARNDVLLFRGSKLQHLWLAKFRSGRIRKMRQNRAHHRV